MLDPPLDLLCHVSRFFRAALKGGFQEEKEKRVTLRDDDPSAFRLFVLWLYKGQLLESQKANPVDMLIAKAWIMGDKLGAPGCQNYIMKVIATEDCWSQGLLTDTETIIYIYNNTTVGSPLRMVVVDMILYVWENIEQSGEAWKALVSGGGDFIVDLLRALKEYWEPLEDGPPKDQSKYLMKG